MTTRPVEGERQASESALPVVSCLGIVESTSFIQAIGWWLAYGAFLGTCIALVARDENGELVG